MTKKIKVMIISLVTLCVLFIGYFLIFSPQAQETISVDGTMIQTLRHYDSIKYPLYVSKEIKLSLIHI